MKDSIIINEIAYNLNDLEVFAWQLLVRGGAKSKDGFHTMTVATTTTEGLPTLRTVVLRRANEDAKTLFFHTDTRSRKFDDLKKQPHIAVMFYDAHRRIQMTLKMKAFLHTHGPLVDDRWAATNAQSRRCFMTLAAPHSPAIAPTSGYDVRFEDTESTPAESDEFRENFAVVECQTMVLEFLYLHRLGNRKAIFEYDNSTVKHKGWLVP